MTPDMSSIIEDQPNFLDASSVLSNITTDCDAAPQIVASV